MGNQIDYGVMSCCMGDREEEKAMDTTPDRRSRKQFTLAKKKKGADEESSGEDIER